MSFASIAVEKKYKANYAEALHYYAKASGHPKRPRPSVQVEIERAATKAAEALTRKDVSAAEWRNYRGWITTRTSSLADRPEHKQPVEGGTPPRRFGREDHSGLAAFVNSGEERWAALVAGPTPTDEPTSR
jgi:hypothetical protein